MAHPSWAAERSSASCFGQCLRMQAAWSALCTTHLTPSPLTGYTKALDANPDFASSLLPLGIQMFSTVMCRQSRGQGYLKGCERRTEYLCDPEVSRALCSSACTAWPAQEEQPSPPVSIMACTNLPDRSAVRFRGQKFMRGFIACFPGATSVKSLRSSSGHVLPEKEVSKC